MNENRYFGMKNGHGGFDGLILQEFKDGGLTLFYLSKDGWVENNDLIRDRTAATRLRSTLRLPV